MSIKIDENGLPIGERVPLNYYPSMTGKEIGCSEWLEMTQDMITRFAELTGDMYFIHVDPEKAKHTAYGATIAHGFLTLSLLSHFARETCPMVEGVEISLNYGLDDVRFVEPVKCGDRIRGRFSVEKVTDSETGRRHTTLLAVIEIEGNTLRPALSAKWHSVAFV